MVAELADIRPIDPHFLKLVVEAFPIVMQNDLMRGKASGSRGYLAHREIKPANAMAASMDRQACLKTIEKLRPLTVSRYSGP